MQHNIEITRSAIEDLWLGAKQKVVELRRDGKHPGRWQGLEVLLKQALDDTQLGRVA